MFTKKTFASLAVAALMLVGGVAVSMSSEVQAQTDFYDTTYEYEYTTTSDELTDEEAAAVGTAILAFYGCVFLFAYIYSSVVFMKIAEKTNTEPKYLAWVPIAKYYIWVKSAGLDGWMTILIFIPFVNTFFMLYVWYKSAEALGHPGWIGLLVLVPFVNFFVPLYLAFASAPAQTTVAQQPTTSTPEAAE